VPGAVPGRTDGAVQDRDMARRPARPGALLARPGALLARPGALLAPSCIPAQRKP
jgi:hypothetical protein